MAQSIGTVLIDIKADTQQLVQGFNKAEQRVNSAVSTMKSSVTSLTTAYLAFEGVISSSKIIDISAQIEKQKAILKTLEGNGDAAKKSFEWIRDFAKQTPFELKQVTDAFIKAKSYGIDPTTGTLKTLGDTASAMGKDINQAIEALADAMVGENERLKEFGIKSVAIGNKISYSWTDSSGQTKKTIIENNKEIIKSTIETIFNSKYQGAMKDQMNTWYGMVSNMKDNYTNFIDAVMTESGTFDGLKNIVKDIGDIGSSLNNLSPEQIKNATDYIKNMGLAVAGSYIAIKSAQTAYSIYNSVLESNTKINKLNIDIEQAKAKAITLGEQAVKARTLADEAQNTARTSGLVIAENHYKMLDKTASKLEETAKKQQAYSYQLEATARGFSASAMGVNLLKTAFSTIPFMVIATGISTIATSLLQASDSSEILEKTLKSTGEELGKLTANQLNYRKSLLETELIQARLELSNAKAKAANGTLADKNYADEMNAKFEELTKASRNVKDALFNIGKETDNLNSKAKKNEPIIRDDSTIIKLMGTEYQKLTLEIEENSKKLKDSGATQAEIEKYKADSIKDFNEKQQKENKKTQDELDKTNKALLDIAQIGMSEYDQGLISNTEKLNEWSKAGVKGNDLLSAEIKLRDELNRKILSESLKEELSYYERKIQLMDNSLAKETELQGIAYANKILEIEASTKSIAEKDKLIAKETELYNATVQNLTYKDNLDFEKTMSDMYNNMLESQLSINDALFNFNDGLDNTTSKIVTIAQKMSAMDSLNLTNKKEAIKLDETYTEQFNKYVGDVDKTKELATQYEKDNALLKEKNIQSQIVGYASIANAMSATFKAGSKEAATFQLAENALTLTAGIRAIINAGTGDPYTAFARMAMMAVTVKTLLGNIGLAFGMNSTSTSSDSFSAMTANNGSGSVLGDTAKQSESITKALGILKDFAQPQYQTLQSMNNYLEQIATNISGVTSLLIQQGGFAFGAGYTGFDTGYKNNLDWGNSDKGGALLLQPINSIISKIPVIGQINSMFGNIMGSVMGGLFGKTSTSQSLTDSGLYFADTLLKIATDEIMGQAYQTISTTVSKKSWFSSSSSTSISSYFQALDDETNRQFSLVLDNLYNTTIQAGLALDSSAEAIAKSLDNFIVSIGKISLKDKTGDEIQSTLESIFGKIGDDISKVAFPALVPFQKVGEGMFETLTRVATGMEEADYYISKLGNKFTDITYTVIGNKQGDVGFEALLQSIEKFDSATYGANNNLVKIIDSLDVTAQELYTVYTSLDELRDRLIFLGQSVQGISNSMISGAGSVTDLQNGFKAFFENFLTDSEQLTYKTTQLISSFNDLGLSLPVSKDSFKALLSGIDLTSEAGQELYGRLITLSQSFADVADSTTSSIEALTTSLNELSTTSFTTFTDSLKGISESITSLKQTALGFINGFTTSNDATLKDQIISYNKLRDQFSSYFDENGIIKAGANKDTVSGLYSSMTSLATSISGKDGLLKDNLISQISNDLVKFNSAEDILKVNIVDGLGSLYNLTAEQTNKLQAIVADGNITSNELSTISGLTQTQKDGILQFASNSTYFSTENTLSSLNEYAKLQLQTLQSTQANETANLSSQTFTYGDYVGKQEQIDIATKLGVSYDTAKPLVEKLQALSISKNPTADIQSILGFNGEDFTNQTAMSQVQSLAQYSNVDIAGIIGNLTAQGKSNTQDRLQAEALAKFEASKTEFYSRYTPAIDNYNKEVKEEAQAYQQELAWGWGRGSRRAADQEKGAIALYAWQDAQAQLANAKFLLEQLNQEKLINGYAVGAIDIPYDQLAQIHKGEMIIPQNFSDGVRQGVLTVGNNNELISSIKDLIDLTQQQAREIQKMRKLFEDIKAIA